MLKMVEVKFTLSKIGKSEISFPFNIIFPLSAIASPIITLYKVDFPEPLGANRPTISPGWTSIDIFFKIALPSYDFVRSLTSNMGLFF